MKQCMAIQPIIEHGLMHRTDKKGNIPDIIPIYQIVSFVVQNREGITWCLLSISIQLLLPTYVL